MKTLTTGQLIAALAAFPDDTPVIMPDAIEGDEQMIEVYAHLQDVVVRHVDASELTMMGWDFRPAVEPWAQSRQVVLLRSYLFDRTEHHAPTVSLGGGAMTFQPVKSP